MEYDDLLLSITRCPELGLAQANTDHPCAGVVSGQAGNSDSDYQVPEPWTGHIETAPILFISSIPGIAPDEFFPRKDWSDEKTIDFFRRRFDDGAGYVKHQPGGPLYALFHGDNGNRTPHRHQPFWGHVRNHAHSLLQRTPVPGTDYALTEVVHCKGPEKYAREAVSLCSKKWMPTVMEHSGADIVILLGHYARNAVCQLWELDASRTAQFNVPIAGRNRAVVILPHPNARGPRKIEHCVKSDDLQRLQALLREG